VEVLLVVVVLLVVEEPPAPVDASSAGAPASQLPGVPMTTLSSSTHGVYA
jgi:hypothetical protein